MLVELCISWGSSEKQNQQDVCVYTYIHMCVQNDLLYETISHDYEGREVQTQES